MPSEPAPNGLGLIPGVTLPWRTATGDPLRRDLELIRVILLDLEGGGAVMDLSGWDDATIRAHLSLMIQGGLLAGQTTGTSVEVHGITWDGHDFLGAVRQDAVWRRVLAKLREAGGGLAMETIKTLALSLTP